MQMVYVYRGKELYDNIKETRETTTRIRVDNDEMDGS